MEIYWQLDATASCTVDYGLSTAYGTTMSTSEYGGDHQHKIQLASLNVNTKYFYRVNITGGTSVTGSFRTGADDNTTEVSFYAYGDTRSQPAEHNSVCNQVVADFTANPANQTFIIVSGDLVNDGNLETDWDTQLFSSSYPKIREMMKSIPYMASMGNHEGNGTLFAKYFPYQFYNGSSGRYYYSFDYGPAHFTIVDQYTAYTVGSTQYNWIVSDLSASTKKWKFILLHAPGWSAGGGHSNDAAVQTILQPLAETYGVQFFIAGHNHYYARATVNNVQHITTGGGGAPLHDPVPTNPYIVKADKSYHFCKLNISGDHLDFTAIRSDGTTIESFTVIQNLTVSLTSPAHGETFTSPANIPLAASVSDNSRVQKVEFFRGSTLIGTDTSAPYALTWSNAPVGTYSITAKATDNSGASTTSVPVSIAVYDPLSNTVSSTIAIGTDDAEETASGTVVTTSTDLELVNDAGTSAGDQVVGMRFTNLLIPRGAHINNAYIQFTCDETNTTAVSLTIKGQAADNPATFTATNGNISARSKTSSSVSWMPEGWPTTDVAGVAQRTPDLASILQEIVVRPGFTMFSPVAIIITGSGSGKRVAEAFEGVAASAANLVVEFTLQPPVTPTFAQIGPLCQNSVPPSLPLVSTNGISGNWSPSVVNTSSPGTMVYTFTPNAGQNASGTTMSITVNPQVTPQFTQMGPYDQGTNAPVLPLTSNNGIPGTWNPATISTALTGITTYTFTPSSGQCATTATMQIEIVPKAYPLVTLTSPVAGSIFLAPAIIDLSANASDADGSISKVAFYQGSVLLGEDTSSPYSFTWTNVPAGNYQLKAEATDNDGQVTTSAIVSITVNTPNLPPSVTITSPLSGATFSSPANLTLTANASDDGSVARVEYFSGNTSLGYSTVLPYSVSWSNVGTGTYTLYAKATDNLGAMSTSQPVSVTVNAPLTMSVTVTVSAGSDDAEEYNAGTMVLNDPYLELVYKNKTSGNQKAGLRFNAVAIPKGATITSAYIQFTSINASTSGKSSLLIQGQAADNPGTFLTTRKNISGRIKTVSSVAWSPGPWSPLNAYSTPDLKAIIQEVVNRAGWSEGSLVFIFSGTGTRTALAVESGTGTPARLVVEFNVPAASKRAVISSVIQSGKPAEGNLACYPVPFTDRLNIIFRPGSEETLQYITLYGVSGNLIRKINNSGNEMSVNLENLTPGIYLVCAQTDRNRYMKTVVKK